MGQSGKDRLYEHFFRRFVHDLREEVAFGEMRASGKNNWRSFASGTRGLTYAVVFPLGERVRAEIYIDLGDRDQNVAVYQTFYAVRSTLEKEFGEPLSWELLESRRACRIAVYRRGKIEDSHVLDEYRRWALERLLRFRSVFGPLLQGVTNL
jgi:hypothetical protein